MYAEKTPKVEAKQNIRGVFEMLCVYDIHTHEVMLEFYDHKSHVEVADILTKLKQRNLFSSFQTKLIDEQFFEFVVDIFSL